MLLCGAAFESGTLRTVDTLKLLISDDAVELYLLTFAESPKF
jgi:hypothetical protein